MSELSKDEQLDPLMKMRLALVAERRAAALAEDRERVVAAQDAIESLDKAIADEATSPH
jgi:hypothetical protein